VIRNCDTCGHPYEAKSVRSRFCSDLCRVRKSRGAAPTPNAESLDNPLVNATRRELEAAGKLDSALGQLALVLAARMSTAHTTAGLATLSKELSRVAAKAIGSTPGTGDDVDELRARRDAKRADRFLR
jgi:hypothetical protein